MIGILKLNSKIQYGKSRNSIPYCLFIPNNNKNNQKNILVASNLKKKTYIDHFIIIDIINENDKNIIGIIKKNIGPVNDYSSNKKFILFKNNIIKNNISYTITPHNHHNKNNINFTYSIDPKNSKDIDDAFSFYDDILEIHITDLTNLNIDFNQLLQTSFTFYDDNNINMLPNELSEDKYSLIENNDRHTISLIINFTSKEYYFKKQIINVNKNLSYEEADTLISNNNTWKNLVDKSNIFFTNIYDSHTLIEQFMIFYNSKFNELLINKNFPIRIHKGLKIINNKINDQKLIKKICYHSATYTPNNHNYDFHEGLQIYKYTHASSPLRRIIDLINQNIAYNDLVFDINYICDKVNDRLIEYKRCYNEIKLLNLLDQIKNGEREFTSYIIDYDDKIKVYIEELDIINNVELFNKKINSILHIEKINDQIIIKNGEKKIIMNLFDKIKIKTSILNYESNLFNKIKFFFIEPNLDSILL